MFGETYIPRKEEDVCMYAWSKRTYLKSTGMYDLRYIEESYIPSMYVFPGKHTYLEN